MNIPDYDAPTQMVKPAERNTKYVDMVMTIPKVWPAPLRRCLPVPTLCKMTGPPINQSAQLPDRKSGKVFNQFADYPDRLS